MKKIQSWLYPPDVAEQTELMIKIDIVPEPLAEGDR